MSEINDTGQGSEKSKKQVLEVKLEKSLHRGSDLSTTTNVVRTYTSWHPGKHSPTRDGQQLLVQMC